MASSKPRDLGHRAITLAYLVGLALISLATIHNVGFDGMTQADRVTLPAFMADSYAKTGKTGVTLFFVTFGLVVILTGHLVRYLCSPRPKAEALAELSRFAPSGMWSSEDNQAIAGRVELQTQKYLSWSGRTDPTRWEVAES